MRGVVIVAVDVAPPYIKKVNYLTTEVTDRPRYIMRKSNSFTKKLGEKPMEKVYTFTQSKSVYITI